MAKTCTTEKTAGRQRWIEQGLQDLMLTQRFEEITVTDLCRHLSLSRRSFYRYFRDLEDVLDSLLNHTFQDMAMPNAVNDIREFQEHFEFWFQRRALMDALDKSGMSSKLMEYTLRFTDGDSGGKTQLPDFSREDAREETRLFIIGGLISLIIAWHAGGFQKTPEQMAQIAYRMLFSPILIQN